MAINNNLYLDYKFIENKLGRAEEDILESTERYDIKEAPFKHVMRILVPDNFNPEKGYTKPAYIYPNFPLNLSELTKFDEDIRFDFDTLYNATNEITKGFNLVTNDTAEKYYYKGTKFLSATFQKNYLKAKYSQQMLVFENFQNVEKTKLDDSFFVDRNLGFLTKKVEGINYYDADVEIGSAISKLVPEGLGYFPPESNKQIEILITMSRTGLVNMLHMDMTFPGDQYIDSIDYIKYSIDGINYMTLDSSLLKMINESFASIYDQNFFSGFVPIHPTFAKYLRIGITQKLASPTTIINSIKPAAIEYTEAKETCIVPVIYDAPYLTNASSEMSVYMPWLFNYIGGSLIFEDGGAIQYKIELGMDKNILTKGLGEVSGAERVFLQKYSKYSSAVLFNYSIFLGI